MPASIHAQNNKLKTHKCPAHNSLFRPTYIYRTFLRPPTPCNQPMPQTSFTDTTCVGEQAQCFPTSTNIHRQQTTIVWRLLPDRPHRTAACIQGRIPVLQPTHQCPCPHNANHNPTICHALAEQFKPCRTSAPHDRYANTNANLDPHPPLPKLPAPA